MFIGHFALGFGAKKYAPGVSLGILLLATQLADLIWPNLVLLGIETVRIAPGNTAMTPLEFVSYPWSHSLVAMLLWGVIFGTLYALLTRSGTRVAIILTVLVLSHWMMDVITHSPDMPLLINDSKKIGLGLWNAPGLAVSLELALFALGTWLYARTTRPLNRKGTIGLIGLVVFLLLIHGANLMGPPPPSVPALAWSAQALWLVVLWGFWVDRHRVPGRMVQSNSIIKTLD